MHGREHKTRLFSLHLTYHVEFMLKALQPGLNLTEIQFKVKLSICHYAVDPDIHHENSWCSSRACCFLSNMFWTSVLLTLCDVIFHQHISSIMTHWSNFWAGCITMTIFYWFDRKESVNLKSEVGTKTVELIQFLCWNVFHYVSLWIASLWLLFDSHDGIGWGFASLLLHEVLIILKNMTGSRCNVMAFHQLNTATFCNPFISGTKRIKLSRFNPLPTGYCPFILFSILFY